MSFRGLRIAAALAMLPLMLSGCELLYGYLDPFPSGPDEFSEPTAYSKGSATMEFTQGDATQTITLTEVSPGSMYDGFFGATVSWQTDDGWVVRIGAYDSEAFGGPAMPGVLDGDVTVERIDGHAYWIAGTYTGFGAGHACTVDISELSAEKVAGRATCPRLRWTDGANQSYEPKYIDGQEPFDVTIAFEAESTPLPTGTTS